MKVFVYGTLRKNRSNHWFLREAKHVCDAYTDNNYTLYVAGLPCMVKEAGNGGVFGEVYEVDEHTLEQLDRLEGHPDFYKREDIWVYEAATGHDIKVQTYIYQGKPKGTKVRSY